MHLHGPALLYKKQEGAQKATHMCTGVGKQVLGGGGASHKGHGAYSTYTQCTCMQLKPQKKCSICESSLKAILIVEFCLTYCTYSKGVSVVSAVSLETGAMGAQR